MGLMCWCQSFKQVLSTSSAVGFFPEVLRGIVFVTLCCVFGPVGALMGCLSGAAIGQTTGTGFFRGCGIGTISGSLVALELIDSIINNNFIPKVGLFSSSTDGGEFLTEYLTHVLLKAYDFQLNNMSEQMNLFDASDIFDVEPGTKGLSVEQINNLPVYNIRLKLDQSNDHVKPTCPVCLEDFRDGDCARILSSCRHEYHLQCIDSWLERNETCPVCRQDVTGQLYNL